MKKEEFVKLGIDEETAKKCEAASQEELKGFIPKTRFDEVNNEKKALELDIKERDTQLENLKKSTGDIDALKKQISTLQEENKAKAETQKAEIHALKVNSAVELALVSAKAKNKVAVKALLKDLDKAQINDDGTIKGLKEQIESLKKSDGYLFETDNGGGMQLRGAKSGDSKNTDGMNTDLSKMSYSQIIEYAAQNPGVEINY